jgi:hypothetical protein
MKKDIDRVSSSCKVKKMEMGKFCSRSTGDTQE